MLSRFSKPYNNSRHILKNQHFLSFSSDSKRNGLLVLEGNPKKVLSNFANNIKHLKLEFFVVNKIVKEEFNKKSSPNYIFWKIGEKTEEEKYLEELKGKL